MNQLIQQAKAKIDQAVKPDQQDAYQRIVAAGMKVMYSREMNQQLLAGLNDAPDRLTATADGIIGILGLLFKQSRNTMPVAPMIMAGQALLLDALDFLEQAQMVEVTSDSLAKCTQHYLDTLLPKLGMTPERMQTVLNSTQGVVNDPAKVGEFKKSMGGAQ
jgi:hypothetical protein